MLGKKLTIGTGILAAILAVAIAVPAWGGRSHETAQPKAPIAARTTPPAWLTALRIRSEALNQKYGLGTSTLQPASATMPAWLVGLSARSDALNRKYKLGEYAVSK